jgi:predicted Zn-dependent protease
MLCGVASVFDSPRRAFSQSALPICRFSRQSGWVATLPQQFIVRRADAEDSSGVPEVVRRITEALSFSAEFDVFISSEENNAFATIAGGKKVLVVDVGFVNWLNRRVGTEWAAISVIAHEIGHHIAGFPQYDRREDRHRSEVNADYWSGQALQKLGAARESSLLTILRIGNVSDTSTHPSRLRRAEAIGKGWDDARERRIDYSFCDGCR